MALALALVPTGPRYRVREQCLCVRCSSALVWRLTSELSAFCVHEVYCQQLMQAATNKSNSRSMEEVYVQQWTSFALALGTPAGLLRNSKIELEEALLNYQDWMDQKTNRPRLNPQVPNYLMNINKDPRLLPSTSTSTVNVDPVPNVQEKGVLCIPGCSHKSIQPWTLRGTFLLLLLQANVQAIIDCFEVEIEKPKKPVDQALTWSQYKNCNTIKYLISATPDGFINFVSEGYGGRISDMYLVEQSGYLEIIPANATILADRGFKHLESHLVKKSVKVLRPPSVLKGTKMTKAEVIDSKILASLRIHIERVIRRVRLIKMLKPHAVVNNKLLNILDDAVVVACGLINLQSPVIRKY
ncbi:hypothetical protein MSG28_014913 [Choristoneura fumiferana]|uniref:Uncharacterized protein n=1 Tax=Choristoneura fumiferana TaxID=7141 RepID=A0ACC0KXJ5_CHOFU|nr:hypothetical protein MSG28_014913 [Choristoneura fumiferana]